MVEIITLYKILYNLSSFLLVWSCILVNKQESAEKGPKA